MTTAEQSMAQLRTACDAQEDQLLAAICDSCHKPFVASDQEALDKQCEACPVIALAKRALGNQYGYGYARGMYDCSCSIRDAYAAVNAEIAERYGRERYTHAKLF